MKSWTLFAGVSNSYMVLYDTNLSLKGCENTIWSPNIDQISMNKVNHGFYLVLIHFFRMFGKHKISKHKAKSIISLTWNSICIEFVRAKTVQKLIFIELMSRDTAIHIFSVYHHTNLYTFIEKQTERDRAILYHIDSWIFHYTCPFVLQNILNEIKQFFTVFIGEYVQKAYTCIHIHLYSKADCKSQQSQHDLKKLLIDTFKHIFFESFQSSWKNLNKSLPFACVFNCFISYLLGSAFSKNLSYLLL